MNPKPIHVTQVSSAPFTGGASRAAFRLHTGLLHAGQQSLWLDGDGSAFGENIHSLSKNLPSGIERLITLARSPAHFLRKKIFVRSLYKNFGPTPTPWSNPYGWASRKNFAGLPLPDIWNFHWVSWMLDWEYLLPHLAAERPIVWTLHDLNPLQGIWHYVPAANERNAKQDCLEEKAIAYKRRCLLKIPKNQIVFVCPSRWMAQSCSSSPITAGFQVEHIPYGLDVDLFRPRPRETLLSMFGAPTDKITLGFIADSISDPRKGMSVLAKALQSLPDRKRIHLLTLGRNPAPINGLDQTHIGALHSETLLSYFYSSCDLFACPSLQDNLPNTVLESLACGTPVLSFKVGGLPDMVRPGVSGFLAESVGDHKSLAGCLEKALEEPEMLKTLRNSCRNLAVTEYAAGIQAQHYLNLYRQLIG